MTAAAVNPLQVSDGPSISENVDLGVTLSLLTPVPRKRICAESASAVPARTKRTGLAEGLFDFFQRDLEDLFSSSKGACPGQELFAAGELVDHYCIIMLVGQGGMADVYLAYDTELDRDVSLKVLRADSLCRAVTSESLLFEGRTLASLNHPDIVTVHGEGQVCGRPYLALEYLEGQTLRERIRDGGLSSREIAQIALTLARVLSYIHSRGIVHCDLKPENIIIGRDGRLKLLDFGLARELKEKDGPSLADPPGRVSLAPNTTTEAAVDSWRTTVVSTAVSTAPREVVLSGTPLYMAPEQWRGEDAGQAVDLWSLGIVLHELLTGYPPLKETTLAKQADKVCSADPLPPIVDDAVPAELASLVARCLQKDPRSRISACDAVSCLELFLKPARCVC